MYYKHMAGEFTPYGFEVMGHLRAIADQGRVDGDVLAKVSLSAMSWGITGLPETHLC